MSFTPTLFDAALSTWLSGLLPSTPVYADKIPERMSTYPCLVYTIVYEVPLYTIGSAAGLVESEVQIDIYGTVKRDVDRIEEQLRANIEGFRGMIGGDILVSSTRFVASQDRPYEPSPVKYDSGYYGKMTEWLFMRSQSIPTF